MAADQVLLIERWDCFQDFNFFIADRLAVRPGRRLHGQIAEHLKEVVLNHVPNGTRFIIERTSALNAKVFRHRDLHALDEVAVPERLHKRVRETEDEHVVHRPFPEVMIDPKDL